MLKKKEVKAPIKEIKAPVKAVGKPAPVIEKVTEPVISCDVCKGTGKNPEEIQDVCPKCKGVK